VYGVALNSLGQPEAAIDILGSAYAKFADDFDIGWALATILRDSGDTERARRIAMQLLEAYPGNASVIALRDSL
jgi:Flp pilus assembly protein TadD